MKFEPVPPVIATLKPGVALADDTTKNALKPYVFPDVKGTVNRLVPNELLLVELFVVLLQYDRKVDVLEPVNATVKVCPLEVIEQLLPPVTVTGPDNFELPVAKTEFIAGVVISAISPYTYVAVKKQVDATAVLEVAAELFAKTHPVPKYKPYKPKSKLKLEVGGTTNVQIGVPEKTVVLV